MDIGTVNNISVAASAAASNKSNEDVSANNVATANHARKNDSTAEADREHVLAAVADMQDYVQTAQRNLQFQLDEGGERMVVTVTEANSGKVIRQIPSEEALRLAENLSEIRSVLFSGKA